MIGRTSNNEANPYHPPISWLTRKQQKLQPKDEIFNDLFEECSRPSNDDEFSSNIITALEKCSPETKQAIASKTKEGQSALFMACKLGHFKKAKYLLEFCFADIEKKGRYEAIEDHNVHSVSPLWVASVSGHYNIVKLLIDHGANINSLSDTGSTPLRSACFLCREDDSSQPQSPAEEILNDLLAPLLPDDVVNSGDQSVDKYFRIVELLVENGADILKPNFNGGTCLMNSIHNYRLTQYIIEHGGDVNASDCQSKTALHYAIQQGRLDVTRLLISHGANPMLCANHCDDALQLSCLGGHLEIFNLLLESINYPVDRVVDAYKLLGTSILELNNNLPKVKELWLMAIRLQQSKQNDDIVKLNQPQCQQQQQQQQHKCESIKCDKRRSLAFGDMKEFSNELELQSFTADDFRIQSLIISERILGLRHRETIQRLLYRGTFYISSMRPDRCINLWCYALQLRLTTESIFHFESIFSAQAIAKLFLDLLVKGQQVKYDDIFDVLTLLIGELPECRGQLDTRPIYSIYRDIFDILLGIIINLLFLLNCTKKEKKIESEKGGRNQDGIESELVRQLIKIDPRSSNGSSLLHLCLEPGIFDSDTIKLMSIESKRNKTLPIIELIDTLLYNGHEIDLANRDGLSALQVLCLSSNRIKDRKTILRHLVDHGAHVDRCLPSMEQRELLRQSLKEADINPMRYMKLSCLAARKVAESKVCYDARALTKNLKNLIETH